MLSNRSRRKGNSISAILRLVRQQNLPSDSAMRSRWHGLSYWLPALAWMALIFAGSTDLLSAARTSPFIVTLLRWLKPDVSDGTLALAIEIIRKGGHLTEYAILAGLALAAMNRSFHVLKSPWSWRRAVLVLAWCAAYAASDEFHQSFVPTRTASGWDVLIDTGGALTALLLVGLAGRVGRAGSASAGGPPPTSP